VTERVHAVIGTAGHIDHGKTMLVKALTGKNTDTLREEQERGITIDIDFAPLVFPDGTVAGVVDVPGHERFIRNMVAGAAGIDGALIVVDVNEGLMPQTYEHLAILQLLGVQRAVVALTKVDLADGELVDVARDMVTDALFQTPFADSPIVGTSVKTGAGIEELRAALYELVQNCEGRDAGGAFRLPVDKVFSIPGFGTVVSGTIWRGQVKTGDDLEVLPGRHDSRVRGLQVHGAAVPFSVAGTRTALNLTGVEKADLYRGCVVAAPGTLTETNLLDARIQLLPDSSWRLRHRSPVHVHLGTAEAVGTILLLEGDELEPGSETLVQIRLNRTIVADTFDRFILRSYSPVTTIGGGHVINPSPQRLYRRKRQYILSMLEKQDNNGPYQRLLNLLQHGAKSSEEIAAQLGLASGEAGALLAEAEESGEAMKLPGGWIGTDWVNSVLQHLEETLWELHRKNRFLKRLSRAWLLTSAEAGMRQRDALWLLEEGERRGLWQSSGASIRATTWEVHLAQDEEEMLQAMLMSLRTAGLQPSSTEELVKPFPKRDRVAAALLKYAAQCEEAVEVADGQWFYGDVVRAAQDQLRALYAERGPFTVAEARDTLHSNRKTTLLLLEYLDAHKFTTRKGDLRSVN